MTSVAVSTTIKTQNILHFKSLVVCTGAMLLQMILTLTDESGVALEEQNIQVRSRFKSALVLFLDSGMVRIKVTDIHSEKETINVCS